MFCTEHHHVFAGLQREASGGVLSREMGPPFCAVPSPNIEDASIASGAGVEGEQSGLGDRDGDNAPVPNGHVFDPHHGCGGKLEVVGASEVAFSRAHALGVNVAAAVLWGDPNGNVQECTVGRVSVKSMNPVGADTAM